MTKVLLAALFVLISSDLIVAQEQPPQAPPVYITMIVKACPRDKGDSQPCESGAPGAQGLPAGYCPTPNNQGKTYDNEHSLTKAERDAYYASIGCIDVPIPPEVVTQELTMASCASKGGYLAAMQYLEQNATITQKAVGGWVCVPHEFPVTGVSSF